MHPTFDESLRRAEKRIELETGGNLHLTLERKEMECPEAVMNEWRTLHMRSLP